MSQGFLYFAKGKAFREEAKLSAQRVREIMPGYPITIVADKEMNSNCFDTVILDESKFLKRNKPQALQKTPYDKTIFFDTDIYLEESIEELFEILDRFEMGIKKNRDFFHLPDNKKNDSINGTPVSFPEFNSGVITYKNTSSVRKMLRDWESRCLPDHTSDQRSLRSALYYSTVRFTCLPNRYNCMHRVRNVVHEDVKILHGPLVSRDGAGGSDVSIHEASKKINQSRGFRYYYPFENTLFIDPKPPLLARIIAIFQNRGAFSVVRSIFKKFKIYWDGFNITDIIGER